VAARLPCAACSSRQCQQQAWKEGHKHECKRLRKQQQAATKLGSCASAAAEVAAALGAGGKAGSSSGGGGQDRPEESNSGLPVPRQVLYPSQQYKELAAAPPHRKQPLGLQNVGNRQGFVA
jgi:hypothetical protein